MNSCRVAITVPLLALLLAAGCNGRSYQVASPVIGPVPPRVPASEVARNTPASPTKRGPPALTQEASLQQVAFEETQPLGMTDVIADVNGEPILAHEVLDRYASQLAQAKQQVKPAQIRKAQMEMN